MVDCGLVWTRGWTALDQSGRMLNGCSGCPEGCPGSGRDQTRTVARPRNHEDLSRGWMCGLWDSIDTQPDRGSCGWSWNSAGTGAGTQLEQELGPADGADDQHRELEDEGESSHAGRQDGRVEAAGNVTVGIANPATDPSMKEVLEAMIALTQVSTPLVNSSVGQAGTIPTAVPLAGRRVEQVAEVVEIDPPPRVVRRMDYLKLLEHIAKMGTKHFAGSVDPLEADEWRSRLVRNFNSTRCPEEYQTDIAVHFLEGDAHNWWLDWTSVPMVPLNASPTLWLSSTTSTSRMRLGIVWRQSSWTWSRVAGRLGSTRRSSTNSGAMWVRNWRMIQYSFHTVSELVERMAMLETNLTEEAKLKIRSHSTATGGSSDRKRKRDQAEEGKPSSGRFVCPKCGRHHGGECWRAMGACLRCDKMDHSARDCPRQEQGAGGDTRTCHYCGRKGHLRKDCPKLSSGPSKTQGEASRC
ncbi:hypothetical protein N665_2316s0003 [Sinapis alba]|nr:hypothetical protein N665_2316s0003 [Sinapis alba]